MSASEKREKAEAKRVRRAARTDAAHEPAAADDDDPTDEQSLGRLRDVHDAFDNERVTFDEFDAQKSPLFDRITKRASDQT